MIDQNILYSECPCGSGKKFKFCCHPTVRSELPKNPTRADVTEVIRRQSAMKRMAEREDEIVFADLDRFHRLIGNGLRHLQAGEYKAATSDFLQAREEFDMLPTAYNNLALCALVQGDPKEAERWVQEVIKRFPVENPFGLALLADLHYLKGDGIGALDILERAEQIVPPSVDQAVRVCESMSHFMDHERIIRYAEKSGYEDDPEMAFFYGIALANSGRRDEAIRVLHIAKRGRQPEYVTRVLHELTNGLPASTICGDWMYLTPESFTLFAGLVKGMRGSGAQQLDLSADVIAELIEVETNGGDIEPMAAVEVLSEASVGRRSERLLNALRSNERFPESVRKAARKAYAKLYEKDGLGERLQDVSSNALQKMIVTEEASTHAPLDPAYEESYFKAVRICLDLKSSRADVKEALRLLEDLYDKVPDNPAVANNYASALSRLGRTKKAFEVVKDCFARHPDYVFGAANYLRQLIERGKFTEAEALVANYRLPQRIHPDAYIAWMKAEIVYFDQIGDTTRLKNIEEAIELVQKQFKR